MFQIFYTNKFKKDVKLLQKRGFDLELLKTVVSTLEKQSELPSIYQSHKLSGSYHGFWEAHIKPDWLIIWKTFPEENELWFTRTGTHADLF